MKDDNTPDSVRPPARLVLRPTAIRVRVSGPRPSDSDWRLRGIGPDGIGNAHIWSDGALADLLLDAGGFIPSDEPDGDLSLAAFVSGDGGGGVIVRLVPRDELIAEHDAADRATRAALIAAGDLDRQRALADPVRARRVIVLHDDGAVACDLELLSDLERRHITAVSRIRIDPEDPGSVLAALEIVDAHVTWYCPDLLIVACDRERRGLPVRALSDPDVLAKIARLPVPAATLPGSCGGLIDTVSWRPFADVDDLDEYVMAVLAQELRRAEFDRLEAIAGLFVIPDAPPSDASTDTPA